jgi:AcrR family transcriptional regulator
MARPRSGVLDLDLDTEPALTEAGGRLLDAAADLFYRRGIGTVGVDLIAEQAGTTKKTLYDCFGSKAVLVANYLRRRAIRWREFLLTRLDDPGLAGDADRVLAVFDALQEWHEANDRGCAFVNAYAEVGGIDHPAVPVVRAEKQWMRELFRRLARGAGARDPEHTGALLHLVYEGVLVQATAGGQPDAWAEGRAGAASILDLACAPTSDVSVRQG